MADELPEIWAMASSYGSLNLFPWKHVRDLQCRKRLGVAFFTPVSYDSSNAGISALIKVEMKHDFHPCSSGTVVRI